MRKQFTAAATSARAIQAAMGVVALLAAQAHAQSVPEGGVVGYVPLSVSPVTVPTLGEWALVGMALALAVVAYIGLRRRTHGAALMALLGMALALGAMPTERQWMGMARASNGLITLEMANTAQTVDGLQGMYEFHKGNAVPYKITSVDVQGTQGWVVDHVDLGGTPECVADLVVPPGSSCFASFELP